MIIFEFLNKSKVFILTGLGVFSLSNFLVMFFGHTLPSTFEAFFKDVSYMIILASVFVFALTWVLRAHPHNRPKKYNVISYDVFGKESKIDGLRSQFTNHDVAWSFMKDYKKSYPLYNFALISDLPNSNKKTIFRYI